VPKYHLPDEPLPGPLGRIAVDPMWPLLAQMVGGAWLSAPWFAINAHAIGSPRRWLMTAVALGGLALTAGLWIGALVLFPADASRMQVRLVVLGIMVVKLAVAYASFALQARPFALHAYYRGIVRNGAFVVLASYFVDKSLFEHVPSIWIVVLR
jgi:hypothetical protein